MSFLNNSTSQINTTTVVQSQMTTMTTPVMARNLSTRVAKKLDKPKPLTKVSVTRHSAPDVPARYSSVISTMEEIIQLIEKSVSSILSKSYLEINNNISLMLPKLKAHGHQLEDSYKDQLDRAFVSFRNACRDEKLEQAVRLNLLYLIELRAMQWQSTSALNNYYSSRSVQMDGESIAGGDSGVINTPMLLGPGEVLKASGKFTAPTKLPGKNYCKDEVVIRNADSGKVMGIRGRRVHMIEELSETVISFQRVSPGAKERLVQITGPNEDKIELAKHLMEDTIKRNASPVREVTGGSNSSLNSSTSDESNRLLNVGRVKLKKSLSVNDTGSNFEYRHTVNFGDDTLHISSQNLRLVKDAKILLDNLFAEADMTKVEEATAKPNRIIPNRIKEGVMGCDGTQQKLTHHALSSDTQLIEMKDKKDPTGPMVANVQYTREMLLDMSNSAAARRTPDSWQQIVKDHPSIVKQPLVHFDCVAYLKKWIESEGKPTPVVSSTDFDYLDSE